jgi:hypothetical protein
MWPCLQAFWRAASTHRTSALDMCQVCLDCRFPLRDMHPQPSLQAAHAVQARPVPAIVRSRIIMIL